MAIDVYCNCGNALSVSPDLAGRKIRCKSCNEVLKIPAVPMDESIEEPASGPDDYEVVSEETTTRTCPSCGATASREDTACLACGADLTEESGVFGLLERVPPDVLQKGGIAFVVIVLLVVGFFVNSALKPGRHISAGRDLLQSQDFAGAEREFKETLKLDRGNKDALIGLVRVALAAENGGLLKAFAESALPHMNDPLERAKVKISLAWVMLEDGEYRKANNLAIEAKADDEKVPGLHAVQGLAALQPEPVDAKRRKSAIGHLQKAADAKSTRVEVYVRLAKLYRAIEDYPKGRSAAEEILTHKKDDPKLWLLVGDLRRLNGDTQGYKNALKKVTTELDPKNPEAHSRLSKVFMEAGELKEALAAAQEAAKLAPNNPEALLAVGRIQLANNKAKAAKETLKKALDLEPDSWEAEFLFGQALVMTGAAHDGMSRIRQALQKQPKNVPLHLKAGEIAIKGKVAKIAVDIMLPVVKAHDENYEARVILARALWKSGHTRDDIEKHLRQAIDLEPSRPAAPLVLGEFLYDELQDDDALKVIADGLKNNRTHAGLLFWKGRVTHRKKQYDVAISAFKACLASDPNYPDAKGMLEKAKQDKFYEDSDGE